MEKPEALTAFKGFYDKEYSNIKNLNQEKLPLDYEIENYIRKVKENEQDSTSNDLPPEGEENKINPLPYNIAHVFDLNKDYFKSLQSWKGYVLELNKDEETFFAELEDLTNGGTKETAQFTLSDVPEDDLEIVRVGAAFYWNVGYRMKKGTIKKESSIRFQRIVLWTEDDFDKATDRSSKLLRSLKFE